MAQLAGPAREHHVRMNQLRKARFPLMARILAVIATLLFLLPVSGERQEIVFETLTETDRVTIRQVIES